MEKNDLDLPDTGNSRASSGMDGCGCGCSLICLAVAIVVCKWVLNLGGIHWF